VTHPLPAPAFRGKLREVLEGGLFQHSILVLIIANAIILGLETSPDIMASHGDLLVGLDRMILAVFVAEILARIYAHRTSFFRDPWSLFDLAVVAIALVPATGQLAVLRALRVLRVLRVLTLVPSMRRVVGGLLAAIPGLSSIAMVLALVFYVFAVITTNLFGANFPDWFGTLGRSLFSLFQIMTLESWSMGIARPVMDAFPLAWLYFLPFILISAFTILNLFIGIIVSSMQATQWEEEDVKRREVEEKAHREREEMLVLLRETARKVALLEQRANDAVE
jgi:voltage-gated sodium channel